MKRISDIINHDIVLESTLPTASLQNSQVVPNALAVLKPGFLQYGDEFENILNANGFRIIRKKQTKLSKQQAQSLYKMHKNKDFFAPLCDYMISDDIICYDCYKDGDDPAKEMNAVKDKVRKMWNKDNDKMKNVMHSPESQKDVSREARIVFGEGDGIAESVKDIQNNIDDNNIEEKMYENPVSVDQVINMLKSLYAEELFAFYNYFAITEFLTGKERPSVQKKFEEFGKDELYDHAAKLLKRINELGGTSEMLHEFVSLNELAKAKYSTIGAVNDVIQNIIHNIGLEEGAIHNYKTAVMVAEDAGDFTTAEMLKDILADEEEHLSELNDFKNDISSMIEPAIPAVPAF